MMSIGLFQSTIRNGLLDPQGHYPRLFVSWDWQVIHTKPLKIDLDKEDRI